MKQLEPLRDPSCFGAEGETRAGAACPAFAPQTGLIARAALPAANRRTWARSSSSLSQAEDSIKTGDAGLYAMAQKERLELSRRFLHGLRP